MSIYQGHMWIYVPNENFLCSNLWLEWLCTDNNDDNNNNSNDNDAQSMIA